MSVNYTCLCVCQKRALAPQDWSKQMIYKLPCGCWELKLSPLKAQPGPC